MPPVRAQTAGVDEVNTTGLPEAPAAADKMKVLFGTKVAGVAGENPVIACGDVPAAVIANDRVLWKAGR